MRKVVALKDLSEEIRKGDILSVLEENDDFIFCEDEHGCDVEIPRDEELFLIEDVEEEKSLEELVEEYLTLRVKKLEAEIERLREALRYYAKNHYPDIDAGPWGPNSNDWGDVARAALGEKE